jgi:hypothetical protein
LGNDWWIENPLAVPGTAVSLAGIGTAIFSGLLSGSGQVAVASAAASQAFLSAAAIAGAVTFSFSFGNWVGEQLKEGGEGTCERIKRRVAAADMLGATIGDIAFTVEVCLPPIRGWAAEPGCQDVGPYQPFSSATRTTPGDAGSLDRNRLASVDFVITPAPGSIKGTVVDAESGDPIAGAVVTGAPDGSDAVTDETGQFTLFEMPVGVHTITVTAEGFSEGSKPIEVESQQITQTTFAMEPGAEFPWTYEGTVTQHIAAYTDFGAQGSIEIDNSFPVTVTLNADGTVSGTVGGGPIAVTGVRCTGTASNPGGEVSEVLRDVEAWQLTGTHDDGTVRFDRFSIYLIYLASGTDVEGAYTPSGIQADWENNVSGEYCGVGVSFVVGELHSSVTGSFTLVRTEPPAP